VERIVMDRDVQEYCNDVVKEFSKAYNDELDKTIYKMLNHFGFKGEKEQSGKWLNDNNYELMMDAEEKGNGSYKTIFLLDVELDRVLAVFMIETIYNDNPSFRVSDIFVNNNDF
jgi:hypothetical protein